MSISNKKDGGFTLVEVAVVVPTVVLIVIGILAMLIVLVTSNVSQTTRSNLVNNTRFALSSIEKDVDASTSFFPGALPSADYSDFNEPGLSGTYKTNGTLASGASSTSLNTVFIKAYNQMIDPGNSTGTKVIGAYKGTSPCNSVDFTQTANMVPVAVLYFVTNGNLYRRTIIDKTNPATCGTLLVKQACPTGTDANTPACTVKDVALLSNVSQFKIDYYLNAGDATPMNAYAATPSPTIDQAKAIVATITATAKTSGNIISHSSSLRMARANN